MGQKDTNQSNGQGILTGDLRKILRETEDIQDFLKAYSGAFHQLSLAGYLDTLLQEKKLAKSEAIRRSQVYITYAYEIFSGKKKNPSRDVLIALALALQANQKETDLILKLGGAEQLHPKSRRDSILLFCIDKKYTVNKANEVLFDMQEPLI